jgi:uncharacterized protein (TIGR02453 family)
MPAKPSPFTSETNRFFRDLSRNNSKAWMDANRERYQDHVVAPFRALLDALAKPALALNRGFDVSGRTGANFSRINRDIRFSKDKTPYRPHMYLIFANKSAANQSGGTWAGGQLYVGISHDAATWGFRVYDEWKGKNTAMQQLLQPRVAKQLGWLKRQAKRLGPKYESYWYSAKKDDWTKHNGWPLSLEDWKKLQGWIVRRKHKPAAAAKPGFVAEVEKSFRELFPLYAFTSLKNWRA